MSSAETSHQNGAEDTRSHKTTAADRETCATSTTIKPHHTDVGSLQLDTLVALPASCADVECVIGIDLGTRNLGVAWLCRKNDKLYLKAHQVKVLHNVKDGSDRLRLAKTVTQRLFWDNPLFDSECYRVGVVLEHQSGGSRQVRDFGLFLRALLSTDYRYHYDVRMQCPKFAMKQVGIGPSRDYATRKRRSVQWVRDNVCATMPKSYFDCADAICHAYAAILGEKKKFTLK